MGSPQLIISDYNLYLKQGSADLVRGYGMAVGRYLRQTGFRLYDDGHLGDAISKFMEIETVYNRINHQLGLVPIFFSLVLLHEQKSDHEKAKKYFKKVIKYKPLASKNESKEIYIFCKGMLNILY